MERTYRQVWTDVDQGIWVDEWEIDGTTLDLETEADWGVYKTTLHGGLQGGVDLIEVDNGALSFFILPTRGMGIWKGAYKDIPLGWDSPVNGPVHPQFVNLQERGGLGWLTGFDEWIVRCGLDSHGAPGKDVVLDNNGNPMEVELTLHGKIANLPARYVEVEMDLTPPYRIKIIGVVDESMMFGPALRLMTCISTELGSNEIIISDEIRNLKAVPSELELLYHCNYGGPLLEEGARLVAPIRTICPRDPRAQEGFEGFDVYGPPETGFVEQVYFFDLLSEPETNRTGVLLKNAAGDQGSYLIFSARSLPAFTLWKNTGALKDGYVTGLEPGTDYPNPRGFERKQGRVVSIPPGETYSTELVVGVCDTASGVQKKEAWIQSIQATAEPELHRDMLPHLSPMG